MREDDEDDVVDVTGDAREVEGEDRLLFGDDGRQQRKERRRREIEETLTGDGRSASRPQPHAEEVEEVDSELEEWEVEQLKKGGVKVKSPRPINTVTERPSRADEHRGLISTQPPISSLSYIALHSSLLSHLSSLRQLHASTQSHSASLSQRLSPTCAPPSPPCSARRRRPRRPSPSTRRCAPGCRASSPCWRRRWRTSTRPGRRCAACAAAAAKCARSAAAFSSRDEADEAYGATAASADVQEVDEFGRDVGYVREIDRQRRDDVRKQVDGLIRQGRERRRKLGVGQGLQGIERLAAEVDGWESEEEVVDEVDGTAATDAAALASFHEDVRGILR